VGGVHLDMELESNGALPLLHELAELSSAVFTLSQRLLLLHYFACGEEKLGSAEDRVGLSSWHRHHLDRSHGGASHTSERLQKV